MTKEKTINGVKFTVTPFQVVEALKLKAYLVRKFGPSLGQALGTLKDGLPGSGNIGDIKLDGTALSQAIENLSGQLGETEFIDLIKRLFRNVQAGMIKDGKPVVLPFTESNFDSAMNIVFADKVFSVYPVMLLVMETNYPDFFDQLARGIGQRIKKIATSALEKPESASDSESSET